jgi:hypothetical protein
MPLLPRKNSLDYNPDATISASKKLKTIALERMKNPTEDPDFATLSTLNSQRNLGDSFDRLESLAGKYHSLVLRLGNLLTVDERRIREQRDSMLGNENLGAGRKKGGAKGDPSSSSSSASSLSTNSLFRPFYGSDISVAEYNRRLAEDRRRFRPFYEDDTRNSSATSASSIYPYDDPSELYIDDDDLSSVSRSTRVRSEEPDYNPNYGKSFARKMPKKIAEVAGANFNSLIFPLIQLTREMTMILNSRIKPKISSLTSAQIQKLNTIYLMVRSSYNDVIFPSGRRARLKEPFTGVINVNVVGIPDERKRQDDFEEAVIENNQFGDEILGTWNEERKNLLLTLTIVVNSWKQNTPTGQQTEFAGDITASYQNTAKRLGKKAELVEAMEEMPHWEYENLQDLESVGREGDYLAYQYQDAESVDDPSVYSGIPGLRQYDDEGKIIPFGAGRKPRGRPRKKDTMTMTMVGNGRNFYGEPINNSRDLPTIWRNYRDCPTKYLL